MQKVCSTCGGSGFQIDPILLKFRRQAQHLSITECAKRMGVSIAYVCELEHGRKRWNSELLAKFNQALQQKS